IEPVISAGGALFAGPEGAEGAIAAAGEIDPLLVRTPEVAVGHDDGLDPVNREELADLLRHLRVTQDVGPDPPLQVRGHVTLAQDDAGGNLGGHFVVRAVEAYGPDGVLPVPVRLRLGGAAELVLV